MTNEFKQGLDTYISQNLIIIEQEPFFKARVFSKTNAKAKAPVENYKARIATECEERSIDDMLLHLDDTFQETVFKTIDEKGLNDVDVYTSAHIDRRLFSKLRSDKYFRPSKKTAIALCFGMKLNLDQARDLLKKAGYSFSHSSKTDLIIEYFLKTGEYNINTLNTVMYEYGETEYWF